MAFEARQVTLQAPDSNTTQDYDVTDFGNPDAAIIMATLGGTGNGNWAGHGVISLGFWDGTSQNVAGAGWQNGGTPGSSDSRHFTDASNVVMSIYEGASLNRRKASITGFSTAGNGVKLSWTGTQTSARPYVTVILLKGVTAQAGHRTAGKNNNDTTQTTTTGVSPKLILFAGRRSDTATGTGSQPGFFMGLAGYNGTAWENFNVGWRNLDTDATDCNGSVRNDGCIAFDCGTTGLIDEYCAVTASDTNSFTTTTTVPSPAAVSSHNYLALGFDESVKAFSSATPTASGDYVISPTSFTPQWLFAYPTGYSALNTARSNGEDGVEAMGIYSVNASDEDGHYATMENGSTGANDMFSQSVRAPRLQIDEVTGTPTSSSMIFGSSPSFNSSGATYADAFFTHDAGSAHQIIGVFVEEQATATLNDGHRGVARGVMRGVG